MPHYRFRGRFYLLSNCLLINDAALTSHPTPSTDVWRYRGPLNPCVSATQTKSIHLRQQGTGCSATYSNLRGANKNGRKAARAPGALKCPTAKLVWWDRPASLKAGYPQQPCVLLWTNCFLFQFVLIFWGGKWHLAIVLVGEAGLC